ncbi:murein hydrolase activator EnvC family protein [Nocardioides cavernaquae]|uniref:M23 family metallopeptidase n=1 Tax=Nocardioides cavernaquae TaxID=2321396 RepID=A0A3A5H4Y7_9ACTN|nr:M23 family metallopeptidase [Nocardioides cavernaquae]RJS44928.1 M23 family metallopeptidase [Nocardioides cavernaquae]
MNPLIPALLTTLTALPPGTPDGFQDPRGTGVWPVGPPVSVVHGFDPPESAFGAGHRGVDLAGAPGAVVRAALGGQVVFAGTLAGRGVITVRHGDTRTTYEPVTATARVGDVVRTGAPIGVMQSVPGHCAPASCLHWGWLRDRTYLDPLELIGARPVRLLPWEGLPVTPVHGAPGPGVASAVQIEPARVAAALLAVGLGRTPLPALDIASHGLAG